MMCQTKFFLVCFILLVNVLANGCRQKLGVTAGGLEQIRQGMSMEQVTEILGEPNDGTGLVRGGMSKMLAGVEVSQSARWKDDLGESGRQIEIGFANGTVAVVVCRYGDAVKKKPEVPAGSFRMLAEKKAEHTIRVVVDVGDSEDCQVLLGLVKTPYLTVGLGGATVQNSAVLDVSGKLAEGAKGSLLYLEVNDHISVYQVDEDKRLSDVLAFGFKSGVYQFDEEIVVGVITDQTGKMQEMILRVVQDR